MSDYQEAEAQALREALDAPQDSPWRWDDFVIAGILVGSLVAGYFGVI